MQVKAILLFLGELGGGEILVIMLVVLLLFGAKKIPDIARSLGSGIREFKDVFHGMRHELESSVHEKTPPASPQMPTRPVYEKTPPSHPQAPGKGAEKEREPGDPFEPGKIA